MKISYDDGGNFILSSAAMNERPNMFEAVLPGIEKDLTPQEVTNNEDSKYTRHMFEGRMLPLLALDSKPDFLFCDTAW